MTYMNRALWVALLCSGISACGVSQHDQSSTKNAHPSAKVGQPEETTRAQTPGGLPVPRTSMALETKYTKAIPLKDGRFAYETVQQ